MSVRFPFVLCLFVFQLLFQQMKGQQIDVQGHRGCRGLLPENTIQGFIRALDLGVTTLEMDLVISADRQVVVSHEPYFSADITTLPDGGLIRGTGQDYNIFQLDYNQIIRFDVGQKVHPRFPAQQKISAVKPLFIEVVRQADAYSRRSGRPLPYYNVEIKRRHEWDNHYHPDASEFAKLVIEQVDKSGAADRTFIQSFDKESLRFCKKINPKLPLVLLVENDLGMAQNVKELGFEPEVYSPYFELVDKQLVENCRKSNIALIPWTVNEKADMEKLLDLGVDGIISDYPDRLIQVVKEKNYTVKKHIR